MGRVQYCLLNNNACPLRTAIIQGLKRQACWLVDTWPNKNTKYISLKRKNKNINASIGPSLLALSRTQAFSYLKKKKKGSDGIVYIYRIITQKWSSKRRKESDICWCPKLEKSPIVAIWVIPYHHDTRVLASRAVPQVAMLPQHMASGDRLPPDDDWRDFSYNPKN